MFTWSYFQSFNFNTFEVNVRHTTDKFCWSRNKPTGAGSNSAQGVERQDLGKVFDFKLSNSLKHAFWDWENFFFLRWERRIAKEENQCSQKIFEPELLNFKIQSSRNSDPGWTIGMSVMFFFYTPWIYLETRDFLFSGSNKKKHWLKMGWEILGWDNIP